MTETKNRGSGTNHDLSLHIVETIFVFTRIDWPDDKHIKIKTTTHVKTEVVALRNRSTATYCQGQSWSLVLFITRFSQLTPTLNNYYLI